MASRVFRKLQFGKEATPGTAVAATALWRGPNEGLRDDRELTWVEEDIGVLAKSDRSYYGKLLGGFSTLEAPVTFEQASYIFQGGIKKVTTPQSDGVGSGKIWAYPFAKATANTIQTFTVEGGDDQQAEEVAYAFCTGFDISGEVGSALMWSSEWASGSPSKTTFTAGLTPPAVEEVLFPMGKLYIDNSGTAFGTTLKSDTLLALNLKVVTGLTARHTANGSLELSGISVGSPEIELELTFEHNATAVAEKDNWRANTPRLLRLAFEGSLLTTGGTDYQKKTFLIDVAGRWSKFDVLDEINGNDVVKGTLVGRYLADDDEFAEFTVVNEIAALV